MWKFLLVGWLAATTAAIGACDEDAAGGGPPYTCQPLCKSANGSLLGSPNDITVHANDEDEASASCAELTNGKTEYCPAGQTVERCSCELGNGS